jgi:putative copper export protein
LGAFPFIAWVLLPGLALGIGSYNTTAAVLHRVWTAALAGALLALLASAGLLFTQAAALASSSEPNAMSASLETMALGTRYGLLWWVRMALLVALAGIAFMGRERGPIRLLLWIGILLALGLLVDLSLISHAAATAGATGVAIIMDWIHLVAMCAWVGGLLHLGLTLVQLQSSPADEATRVAGRLVERFSFLGAACVLALILTGAYASWIEIGSLAGLFGTLYGQTLLVKLGLILPLVAIAAVHLRWIRPALLRASARPRPDPGLVLTLRTSVLAEAALVGLVLLVVGVLTNLQPGREALRAQDIEQPALGESETARSSFYGLVGEDDHEHTVNFLRASFGPGRVQAAQ